MTADRERRKEALDAGADALSALAGEYMNEVDARRFNAYAATLREMLEELNGVCQVCKGEAIRAIEQGPDSEPAIEVCPACNGSGTSEGRKG